MLYQVPHHHPWPSANSLQEVTTTNQVMDTNFAPTDMSREPLQFPNLVNGFDRNPAHAARSALYTRYTPSEWHTSCITSYNESDTNRHQSERLRNDAVRLMRQTEEQTSHGQREAGRRLGERLTDLTFWRNELNIELEKVISEYSLLADMKRRTTKALEDLDPPLKVTEECLYFRENRQGIEKVHDVVEKTLLNEVKNLKAAQEKLKQCLEHVGYDAFNNLISKFGILKLFNFFRLINLCPIYELLNTHWKKISFTRRTPSESIPFVIN